MNITSILKGNKDEDITVGLGIVTVLIIIILILLIFYCYKKEKKKERKKYPSLLKSTKSSTNSFKRTQSLPTVLKENNEIEEAEKACLEKTYSTNSINSINNSIKKNNKGLYPNLEGHNIL